jgi:quinol monooxygenase YgiN
VIFICVKWKVKPEHADRWVELTREFTEATRAEEGNLFFEWNRSVDADNVFTLVEAFRDADAGAAHVQSEHFRTATAWMGDLVTKKPDLVYVEAPGQEGWGEMGEVTPTRG